MKTKLTDKQREVLEAMNQGAYLWLGYSSSQYSLMCPDLSGSWIHHSTGNSLRHRGLIILNEQSSEGGHRIYVITPAGKEALKDE